MISIVIPIYNEALTIPELHRRLSDMFPRLGEPAEVIFANDGSRDRSLELLTAIARADNRFKVIDLARNFGHQVALSAGLDFATGDAVVLMDGDLQDPPELVPHLAERWKEGFQVVYTMKRSRREGAVRRFFFHTFYKLMQRLSAIPIPMEAGNFSLMDRRVIDVLRSMPERHRYIAGMRAWAGFRQTGIAFDREARFAGTPGMSLVRLFGLAFDALFSFSNIPLRVAAVVGLFCALIAFAGGLAVLYAKLFTDMATPGWASPVVSILFIGGLILLTLGIIGEYIGRIYDEVKRRPLYVVKSTVGFPAPPA